MAMSQTGFCRSFAVDVLAQSSAVDVLAQSRLQRAPMRHAKHALPEIFFTEQCFPS